MSSKTLQDYAWTCIVIAITFSVMAKKKKRKPEGREQVAFRIDRPTLKKLMQCSSLEQRKESDIMRRAIREYYSKLVRELTV